MLKKFITIILVWLIVFSLPIVASALNSEIDLYLNGKMLSPTSPPEMIEQSVHLSSDSLLQLFDIDEAMLSQSSVVRKDGKLYYPIRLIAEQHNMKVSWDALTRSVSLYQRSTGVQQDPVTPKTPVIEVEHVSNLDPISVTPKLPITNSPSPLLKLPAVNKVLLSQDVVTIEGSGTLAATPLYLKDPAGDRADRLVIDIHNAVVADELERSVAFLNGVQKVEHAYVKEIRYSLFSKDPSTVRVVLELKKSVEYAFNYGETERQLLVTMKPSMNRNDETKQPEKVYTVVVDPGHGGDDQGAGDKCDCGGFIEKDFTLPFAQKVYEALEKMPGIKPVLTRTDDSTLSLDERVNIANALKADVFISLHGNSFEPDKSGKTLQISGTETYYWDEPSLLLANSVHPLIVKAAGFPDREIRKSAYRVIKNTMMPAILVEIGYMSTAAERQTMWSESFQNNVAQALANGIKDYLAMNE